MITILSLRMNHPAWMHGWMVALAVGPLLVGLVILAWALGITLLKSLDALCGEDVSPDGLFAVAVIFVNVGLTIVVGGMLIYLCLLF